MHPFAINADTRAIRGALPSSIKSVRAALRVLGLVALLGGTRAFCASYYCDPSTGNMANSGSSGSPWTTLQAVFAAGKTFAAGDTIYLRNGNHGFPVITADNTGDVTITKQSGHDPVVNRIEFDGATHWVLNGVKVYINADRPDDYDLDWPVAPLYNNSLVRMTNTSSYITIRNCNIYSSTNTSAWTATNWNEKAWNGIYMGASSHHLTIEDNDVTNTNFAIHMEGNTHHIDVRGNIVQNFCGDGIRANCDDLTIEYNYVADAYGTNGNHYDLIQGFGRARVQIRGNILLSTTSNRSLIANAQGIGSFEGGMEDWVVENNLIAVGHYHGLTLLGIDDSRVVNNTVTKNPFYTGSQLPWITISDKDGVAGTGNVMRNNISALAPSVDFPVVGTTSSNNIITTSYTSHFVNYTGLDFRLKTTSSAVDAGTTTDAPSIDLNGGTRFAPYDVGAYEHPDAITASADSYTFGGSTSQNNGTSLMLTAKDGSGTSFDRTTFLKFNLSGLGSAPTTATLVLTPDSATQAGTVYTRSVATDSWTEGGITWANQPTVGGTNLSSAAITAGQTTAVSLNVTAFVQGEVNGDGTATIALTANDASLYFKSRENGSTVRPKLVFTQ